MQLILSYRPSNLAARLTGIALRCPTRDRAAIIEVHDTRAQLAGKRSHMKGCGRITAGITPRITVEVAGPIWIGDMPEGMGARRLGLATSGPGNTPLHLKLQPADGRELFWLSRWNGLHKRMRIIQTARRVSGALRAA